MVDNTNDRLTENPDMYRLVHFAQKALFAFFMCASCAVFAGLDYSPKVNQASWKIEATDFECRLRQNLPAFGEAIFERRAGQQANFHLTSFEPPVDTGHTELLLRQPNWKPSADDLELGTIAVSQTTRPIDIPYPMSDQLLGYLQQGLSPVFSQWPWYGSEVPIQVRLSVVNFLPAYREYQRCVTDLPILNFADLSDSKILFDTAEYDLSAVDRQRLQSIAQLIKADPNIKTCYIDGYTDEVGTSRANVLLSRRRAESVEAYLVAQGVDPRLISSTYHGEANWVAPSMDDASRAKNRRVTIRLEK